MNLIFAEKKPKYFTEYEFTKILLSYMKENGINEFLEAELCKNLIPYYKNEKYKNLFINISLKRNQDELDLHNSLGWLKQWGVLAWITNYEKRYITFDINSAKAIIEEKDEQEIALIQEIARHFAIRKKVEKSVGERLNIYGINPNKYYQLIDGEQYRDQYTRQLITDGIIEKEFSHEINPNVFFENPVNLGESSITFEKQTNRTVSIKDATFVIEQGLLNEEVEIARLNTEILEEDVLMKLASHAYNDFSVNGKTLTEEKPHVYSFKMK